MQKIDFKKTLKEFYGPSVKAPVLVTVPKLHYLMIDGKGDPNTALEYQQAIEALYGLAYTLKFMLKLGPEQIDAVVMPLEGLWWVPEMSGFSMEDKAAWLWTAMIMAPEFITREHVEKARTQLEQKKNPPALNKVRLESYDEGLAAQIMYLGAYADEAPTIQSLHEFIAEQGYALKGKHHEIYLSDPRRTAPEKLKTVIRQPCGQEPGNRGVQDAGSAFT